jgi:hypothetical protein
VGGQPGRKTEEVQMAGQLAFATDERDLAPAAVWEMLPPTVAEQVTLRLARLLARLLEAWRDE